MAKHVEGLLTIPGYFIAFFLFVFSVVPTNQTGWLYGQLLMQVRECPYGMSCMDGRVVRFQVTVDPFMANILWGPGTLEVARVPWSALNSKDLCETPGRLNSDYAVPNNLCSENNEFVMPSAIPSMQALAVLTIIFSMVCIILAVVAAAMTQPVFSWAFTLFSTSTTAFAAAVLGLWESLPLPKNVSKDVTNTLPMWNATLIYQGQVLIRSKHSSRYEDKYSITWSDTLVATPEVIGFGSSSGYNLWIAGLVFVALCNVIGLMMCCGLVKETRRSSHDAYGSGAYAPTSSNNAAPYTSVPSYISPPGSQRPSAPPPPPPTGYETDKASMVLI